MLNLIDNTVFTLLYVLTLIKQFGSQLKASTAMLHLHLYKLFLPIPIKFYEQHFKFY
jgi:hypothetical protein